MTARTLTDLIADIDHALNAAAAVAVAASNESEAA